ncbi:MAG: tRNA (cytidine(56)-2'-O)-methyltransferase [Euryarchaeota archaeon]|nr:tRNA (cytidine(56)-2'-O)-methyltransferase [Euryarchaeota archaeon]MBU4492537.1 tRNA (cytidine(56)-2'-O)-methyltransferase [Euryarchaeota archaeon]MCG2728007.1 tRNA (cytidine(56)-2'-O)-methyltransferase [Candidatus Methanoperedenaceae archaeon]
MRIMILRLGHRIQRDQRITTHVALTARALGAEGMLLASEDEGIGKSLNEVAETWGGSFYVKRVKNWKSEIKKWKESGGKVLHLTMYGINLPDIINEIKTENLMLVVGAEKVPPDLYKLADWNVAIGNQPHSEVAALAITLDRLKAALGKDALKARFAGGELEVVPKRAGKEVKGR